MKDDGGRVKGKATAVEAFFALSLFASLPVVIKSIDANPYTIGVFRLAVATVFLGALLAARGELKGVARGDVARLAAIGFLFFGHWLTFFLAVKTSSASVAAIGLSTYGVDLLILGVLFAGERVRVAGVMAVLLAAAGAVLVVPALDLRNDVAVGMLLASLSALLYAALPILHQRWSHIATSTRALGQFAFALLFFALFLPRTEWSLAPRDWAGLLFLAVGVTLIGHSLWVRVTTRLPPSTTSILYYGNIPVAVLLSVVLLKEPLTARMIAGALLIIAGSVLGLIRRPEERRHPPSSHSAASAVPPGPDEPYWSDSRRR